MSFQLFGPCKSLCKSVYGAGRGEEPVCAERAEAGAGQAGGPGAGLTKKGINQRRYCTK